MKIGWILAVLALVVGACGPPGADGVQRVRIGYFPNLTHAQALIGCAQGRFQKALGEGVQLETRVFNAGPSVIEALFANALDVAYIGPNPALTGFVRSQGKALRIVAGAASGGAVFMVRAEGGIRGPADLAHKRIATPQLGNTQDLALRTYLQVHGLAAEEKGGNVRILPVPNPDILSLMRAGEIDGAWVPAPWGPRLEAEVGAELFLDERDLWPGGKFVTAHVIVRTGFLRERPRLVRAFLEAHVDATLWIRENPAEAVRLLDQEIRRITRHGLAEGVLERAFASMEATYDPIISSLHAKAKQAFELGFLGKSAPDLSEIYDLSILRAILADRDLPGVE